MYSQASAEKDGSVIATVYTDRTVSAEGTRSLTVVNASYDTAVILKDAGGRSYTVVDCMGEKVEDGSVTGDLAEICVPTAGMILVQ